MIYITFILKGRSSVQAGSRIAISSRPRHDRDMKNFVRILPKGWIVLTVGMSLRPMTTLILAVLRVLAVMLGDQGASMCLRPSVRLFCDQ